MEPPVVTVINDQVHLTWSVPPSTDEGSVPVSYTVQVRVKEVFGFGQPQPLYLGAGCEYLAAQLPPGRTVNFRVRAQNKNGDKCPYWSDWVDVTVPGVAVRSVKKGKKTVILSNVELDKQTFREEKKKEAERAVEQKRAAQLEHRRKEEKRREEEKRRKIQEREEQEEKAARKKLGKQKRKVSQPLIV